MDIPTKKELDRVFELIEDFEDLQLEVGEIYTDYNPDTDSCLYFMDIECQCPDCGKEFITTSIKDDPGEFYFVRDPDEGLIPLEQNENGRYITWCNDCSCIPENFVCNVG